MLDRGVVAVDAGDRPNANANALSEGWAPGVAIDIKNRSAQALDKLEDVSSEATYFGGEMALTRVAQVDERNALQQQYEAVEKAAAGAVVDANKYNSNYFGDIEGRREREVDAAWLA